MRGGDRRTEREPPVTEQVLRRRRREKKGWRKKEKREFFSHLSLKTFLFFQLIRPDLKDYGHGRPRTENPGLNMRSMSC